MRPKLDSLSFNMARVQGTSSLKVNGIKNSEVSIKLVVSKKLRYVQLISGIERSLFLRFDDKRFSLNKYSQIKFWGNFSSTRNIVTSRTPNQVIRKGMGLG